MDFRLAPADEAFRSDVRDWLAAHVVGEFSALKGAGGPGLEHEGFDVRVAWERELGAAGWIGLGWPTAMGGRGASITEQIIWAEEYARIQAPARVNHMGENLLGPTLIAYGTPAQQRRFLPGILRGEERWCQGYSEPNAGSDLANISTRAVLDDDEWVLNGQKVWTSLAHVSHWCFVVARTTPGSNRHKGLTFLLVPMDQPGVEVRPIVQATGTSEFNEVFFTDARTASDMVIGAPGEGWGVAMALLGFERGVSTLAQQIGFAREVDQLVSLCRAHGRLDDPTVRQRFVTLWTGLRLMQWNALRTMSSAVPGPEASISKLFWGTWHQDLTNMMVDVMGPAGLVAPPDSAYLGTEQSLFLFSRSDTIYGGSNEVQRNVLGERVLGLPKEPVVV